MLLRVEAALPYTVTVQRFVTTVICSRRDKVKGFTDTSKTIAYNDNMQVIRIVTECLYFAFQESQPVGGWHSAKDLRWRIHF